MSGAMMSATTGRGGGGGGSHLDTQSVTTGAAGTAGAQDRVRGYDSNIPTGAISDGTSNIYSGTAVTVLCYYEGGGASAEYQLEIPGAANSGWTSMTITGPNGTKVLNRASATSFAAGFWRWSTVDTIPNQAFGPTSSAITIDFD